MGSRRRRCRRWRAINPPECCVYTTPRIQSFSPLKSFLMVFPVDGCSSLGLSSSLTVIDTDEKEESSNNNNNNRLLF